MTIRHLKIFIAVAEQGGMRRASEVLYISQPSISQAIMELEKHYNVRLFERLSKKLYKGNSTIRSTKTIIVITILKLSFIYHYLSSFYFNY